MSVSVIHAARNWQRALRQIPDFNYGVVKIISNQRLRWIFYRIRRKSGDSSLLLFVIFCYSLSSGSVVYISHASAIRFFHLLCGVALLFGWLPIRTQNHKGASVRFFLVLLLPLLCLFSASAEDPAKFSLSDGDRVAFVGNTFTERDQHTGYFETLLTARYFDRNIIFRNLGWSGDTVWGTARASFGSPQDGFNSLAKALNEFKPTWVMVTYGMSESFEGESGLADYLKQLDVMLNMLAGAGRKIVMISPIKHENLAAPLPDPAEHNKNLRLYIDAMKKVAGARGYIFVDLYELLGEGDGKTHFTDNGIHLTPYGYWRAALALEKGLGLAPTKLDLDPTKTEASAGRDKAEQLRAAIQQKNEFFFNRWRPQNETYIYGFRKKEQGKNAAFIPQFDPMVVAKEAEIATLRGAVAQASELKPEGK